MSERTAVTKPQVMSRPHVRVEKYVLRLFVHRTALKSEAAIVNLTRVCEEHLKGRYVLEVIDIAHHASLARREQIVAVPTLIKQLPVPVQRLVGDMSNVRSVLSGLNLAMREQ
jgi:circadian clock protein KaiB